MKLKDRILSLLFPNKCVFCRKIVDTDGVCSKCLKKLPYRTNSATSEEIPHMKALYAPLYYEGDVRSAVLRYKFGGVKASARVFAGIMYECINNNIDAKLDTITWVPTSKKRISTRGYDQAEVLAKELGKLFQIPVKRYFVKNEKVKPQSKNFTHRERRANVLNAFTLVEIPQDGENILLVDDVATTGSTVSECARLLGTLHKANVYGTTLTKTRLK